MSRRKPISAAAPGSADRRVQRTRRILRDALSTLLQERNWDEIGVQDICERADVGRSTFYMHYHGKEQLLAGALDDLRATLREQGEANNSGKPGQLSFVRGLIGHAYDQRKLFRAVVGRKSGHVVQMRFREMVRRLVAEDLAHEPATGWQREAAVHYVTGALVELLAWWVDARTAVPPDEVERCFQRLALCGIAPRREPAG